MSLACETRMVEYIVGYITKDCVATHGDSIALNLKRCFSGIRNTFRYVDYITDNPKPFIRMYVVQANSSFKCNNTSLVSPGCYFLLQLDRKIQGLEILNRKFGRGYKRVRPFFT